MRAGIGLIALVLLLFCSPARSQAVEGIPQIGSPHHGDALAQDALCETFPEDRIIIETVIEGRLVGLTCADPPLAHHIATDGGFESISTVGQGDPN